MAENVTVNEVNLSYIVSGSGPPLYLLHGGMESRKSFKNQIPVLADHFTVVAVDSRGQGHSGPTNEEISYELMSQDVLALAKHIGHTQFSIMGSSDGGVTAMTIAMRNPEKVDKLVLLGTNFHFHAYSAEMRSAMTNYEWDGDTDPLKYPGIFIEHYLSGREDLTDFDRFLKQMSVMWTTTPVYESTDLKKIQAKTLIINGDREDTDLNHVLEMYVSIPNSQLFVVPGGTHYAMLTHAELVNRVVSAFLRD